jgi:hypothetical protein
LPLLAKELENLEMRVEPTIRLESSMIILENTSKLLSNTNVFCKFAKPSETLTEKLFPTIVLELTI